MIEQKSQSIGWHHSVAVIEISPVTMLGRADMYFDGKKIGQTKIDGMYIWEIVY